jgi:hypothetical protein
LKSRKKKIDALNAHFDPVYERRIADILARDPIADADALHHAGIVAFLWAVSGPSKYPELNNYPGVDDYPGVHTSAYDITGFFQNRSAAEGLPMFVQLASLTNPNSEEVRAKDGEPCYYSPVFVRFINAEFAYKVAFNREMYRLAKETKPKQ